ncbi:hypothetical protein, conserved [Angomonas deanei]|uniref:Uncharacterized protein n=1 Tax=Angomonas deanei TaxID=59799 RepID=A0A7G2CK91_9TRYP|nr:hypothetical protein, conserved [Angomonas deanei]
MEERHEMLLRSMEALVREEAYQRQILHDDVATHLNALFTEMSDSENRIRELVHQRLDDVNRFCMNASSAVTRVRESEDEAWRSLMQLEAEERERCAQLKMEKEAAIQKFCSDSFAAMQQVAAEEAEAFHQLNSAMRDEESRIAEQHAWLLRRSQETYMQCVTEVQDIKEEEHTARFQLLSLMAKGEETIHRQQRMKEQEIHSLEKEEADSRGHVCQGEEVARENLYYAFDRDARLVEERVRGQQERLEAFCRSALDLLRALQEEESTRFAEIAQTFLLECNAIRLRESFKQQLVIQQEEAQGRSFVEVEEQSMRGIMIGKKNAILQFFADERDRVWRAFALSIAQVVEGERAQREMLSQRESSDRDAFRQSELEERRRLTEPVLDDAYLYRKQLLLSTLSVSGEVKLTAEQIDTALHILDCASEKEKEAQQSLKVAQKRAKDLTRKMARLEDACKEEAEKKEDIRNRLTREEGERERRLNAEVDASRRDAEQIAVEKRKLEESEEELRKQEAILASFKAKINKQYSR